MITAMSDTGDRLVTDAAIAGVEQQFAVMFTQVKANLRDRAVRVHPELQALSYTIITSLVRSGPTRAGELAERLNLDKSIISRQANLLCSLGFVEREPDPDDRRATVLAATRLAVERVDEVRRVDQAALYENLRDWEVPDLHKLAELLGRLNEATG
jgi:DNA-binding MarR family transcriptional regulator